MEINKAGSEREALGQGQFFERLERSGPLGGLSLARKSGERARPARPRPRRSSDVPGVTQTRLLH